MPVVTRLVEAESRVGPVIEVAVPSWGKWFVVSI
jgi:hypothetical protein